MQRPAGLFLLAAALIAAAWWWLGAPVAMPPSPLAAGEKLYCLSYTPFRGAQNPLDPTLHIERWQIEEDLAKLAALTNCVRTYSTANGLDAVPAIAKSHGLKVLQGLWLNSNPQFNRGEIARTVALAKQFPDVITAIVVGNEVLLRGEMAAPDLANTIRSVKAQVPMPVTYADVWEFWLRYREVAAAVDFITIHILPYWEDLPISATRAAAHVEAIHGKLVAAFPGKEILIGETGWPSRGRMREGALPSPANQALALHEILATAKRDNFHVNVIEAFDQPWKRYLEGTVGGYWGLLSADTRDFKFAWGMPVSDHPYWRWQMGGGIVFAALIFGGAILARRRRGLPDPGATVWAAVAVVAAVAGILAGWTVENMMIESLGLGGWVRSAALLAVALLAPLAGAAALSCGVACPGFARILGSDLRQRDPLSAMNGWLLAAVAILAVQSALGFDFDPRYRDFPFAPLTAAVVPFLMLSVFGQRETGKRGAAETAFAAVLAASAIYIVPSETLANWQALWFAAVLAVLAVILLRQRDAQG